MGALTEKVHGRLPYEASQARSKALHGHPMGFAGIFYDARHDDEAPCVALLDRAAAAIVEMEHVLDIGRDRLWELPDRYGAGISPG